MLVFAVGWAGCSDPGACPDGQTPPAPPPLTPTTPSSPPSGPPNVLLILADDVGIDKFAAYGVADDPPPTPAIDSLFAEGVRFHNAWALPTCSPARAALVTGRFGRRYGIGEWFALDYETWSLPRGETTIPEVLARAPTPYASVLAGKWHVVARSADDAAHDPQLQGFLHHRGTIANVDAALTTVAAAPRGYCHWERMDDGEPALSESYATTVTTDDAIDFVRTLPEPWFVFVSYNAAHSPFHVPPAELTPSDPPTNTDRQKFDAALEAMDTEIGRLLASLTPAQRANTDIFFLGDNGTPWQAVSPPVVWYQAKGSMTEGGSRVPFVVAGPSVAGHGVVSEALVSVVDLLPTFAELAGLDPDALLAEDGSPLELDGHSLVDLLAHPSSAGPNTYLYTERFYPNGPPPWTQDHSAVRDARYKLVVDDEGEHLYDLTEDLDDGPDLLASTLDADAQDALGRLEEAIAAQHARVEFEDP